MRRSFWSRVLSALWSIWLVAALTDAGGLHTCPTHGMHVGHSTSASGQMAGMHHMAAAHDAAGSRDSQTQSQACTCLGSCCVAPAIAAPTSGYQVVPSAVADARTCDFSETAAPRLERAHAYPFPNGPPAQV